jgi:hypothetical protein
MNTQENNKIIAEFMGYPRMTDAVDDRTIAYDIGGSIMNINNTHNQNEDDVFHPDDMKFHKEWNWLMPVVETIESFQDGEDGDSMRGHLYNFRIEQHFVYILDGESMDVIIEMNGDSKLDATYNAVVEFINQYNKNK